jgi:hypothetical protein
VTSPSSNPTPVDPSNRADQHERAEMLITLLESNISAGAYRQALLDARALVDALTHLNAGSH